MSLAPEHFAFRLPAPLRPPRRSGCLAAILPLMSLMMMIPASSRAQSPGTEAATIDTTVEAGESDAVEPKRKFVKWNEFDGPVSTLRFGYGFLIDFSSYIQDDNSKKQVSMEPDVGMRDFRFLLKGRFKTERPLSWMIGYMYDGSDKSWHFRQSGIQVDVPELSGRFFVGRTKEGYSEVKVRTGYHGWTNERSQALDAFVPILADGIKYLGYYPRARLYLNLGWYGDMLSESEKFATYDQQFVTRLVWQPILSEAEHKLLHIGVMSRDGKPDDGKINFRSRPGDYLAPYFIETGKITADHGTTLGVEAYYRPGPWLFGTEYNWQTVDAANGEHPWFNGGDAVVAWIITGETRPYSAPGAYFNAVSPKQTVFERGLGAWEAVLHFSYADFDDGSFQGGKFWRLTPMVNWYLTDYQRLEFVYGYGVLDRFGLTGRTQFFQARIQTTL